MQVKFDGTLNIKATDLVLKEKGLNEFGEVQKFIDKEVIRLMEPFTPHRTGALEKAPKNQSVIGSGEIIQDEPYARYLYYGKLMVDPVYLKGAFTDGKGTFWSRPDVTKILDPSGRNLEFDKSAHPEAGPFWFKRMKEKYKEEILKGARDIVRKNSEVK